MNIVHNIGLTNIKKNVQPCSSIVIDLVTEKEIIHNKHFIECNANIMQIKEARIQSSNLPQNLSSDTLYIESFSHLYKK